MSAKSDIGIQDSTPALFSADSHVIETPELWEGLLPRDFWPKWVVDGFSTHPGGKDPTKRIGEMQQDNVAGEVLYPSLGLGVFAVAEPELQAACCHRYNEWLSTFCAEAPDHLFGVGMIPTYDTDVAIAELEYCIKNGMRSVMVWQSPHPDLPFSGRHYDPFWEAAQSHSMPVSLHIQSGFSYSTDIIKTVKSVSGEMSDAASAPASKWILERVRLKLDSVVDSLADLIFSGVFERYPELRLVIVENEVGWLPFIVDQFDYYSRRVYEGITDDPFPAVAPSEYVRRNVRLTFFRDPLVRVFAAQYPDIAMWSNDFPHTNSTWPRSQDTIDRLLAGLGPDGVRNLVWGNAARLYGLEKILLADGQLAT